MKQKQFPIVKKLDENPSHHCATLAVSESLIEGSDGLLKPGHPDEKSRNGTLTFVTSAGKTFAITCWHVIEYFHKLNSESIDDYKYSLYTMTPRPYIIIDRFIRPSAQINDHKLDIAICQVKNEFVKALAKEPIDIDNQHIPKKIEFGIAIEFPEALKYVKENSVDSITKIISLPTVSILAEINHRPNQRFYLYSEFDEVQGYETYSGMSGGPIFWSNKNEYGIYGITYEANPTNFTEFGKSIMLAGELATPKEIKHWISQIPEII